MILSSRHILIISLLLGGTLSVFFGKELCWDLANYHFYNPFALLYGRHNVDYWPNSHIHQYINPVIDLLSYFLIQFFTPLMSEFILGAIHGINLWLLFLIAQIFLKDPLKRSFALILAFAGVCGPTALPGIGSFQNDNLISIFVLGFVLLQLKAFETKSFKYQFLASLSLGLGFGLKLTAGIYVVSAIFTILLLPISWNHKIKGMILCGFGIMMGMLITGGYWMLMMWREHHNPLFPFLNHLFHSPDFSSVDWRDTRFLPKNLAQTLFFPFYFSLDGRTADAPFRDFRFPVIYILFIAASIQWLRKKTTCFSLEQRWLFIFFIFSYAIWQYYFSIARYLAPLEMLAPLMIYLLVHTLVQNRSICLSLVFCILLALMFSLSPIPMIRAPWYDKTYFNVTLPASVKPSTNATVLMAYPAYVLNTDPRPQSYLIPFFPYSWRFIGIPLLNEKMLLDAITLKHIQEKLAHSAQPVYLLTSDRNMPELYRAARLLGFKAQGECGKITSDRQAVTHQNVLLCPVSLMLQRATSASS